MLGDFVIMNYISLLNLYYDLMTMTCVQMFFSEKLKDFYTDKTNINIFQNRFMNNNENMNTLKFFKHSYRKYMNFLITESFVV